MYPRERVYTLRIVSTDCLALYKFRLITMQRFIKLYSCYMYQGYGNFNNIQRQTDFDKMRDCNSIVYYDHCFCLFLLNRASGQQIWSLVSRNCHEKTPLMLITETYSLPTCRTMLNISKLTKKRQTLCVYMLMAKSIISFYFIF